MKPKTRSLIAAYAPRTRTSLIVCVSLCAVASVNAASDSWDGSTNGIWATSTNWLTDPATVPGTGDTATFNGAGNGNTTINLGAGVTVGTLLFDLTPAAYTIGSGAVGSQTLTLNDTGAVTMNSTVANNQLFNANITLGTAITGTTTVTNSATAGSGITLNVAGTIAGGSGGTAGTKTLNTTGSGAINLQGVIDKGGATVINVANVGTGTTTLSGAGSMALGTLRATGINGNVTVNNAAANITVTASSSYGPGSSGSSDFFLTAGTVAFNGGLTHNGSNADGSGFIVNGGTFSASTIFTTKTFNFSTASGATTATAQNMFTSGFQVNGGTATVTGAVNLAGSNSAANGQVSGTGALTIGGELILGAAANTRTTLFQVTGGTLTNSDVTNGGIAIGKGSASVASSGELLLTGGTTTTEKISFGLNSGLAGSFGNLTMNGASANLYVGSGGIVLAATNAYTQTMNLTAGTLGAKANWSTAVGITFSGSGTIIKAADVSDVSRNITLDGVLAGTGNFTKSGGGTLLLTNSANTFSGIATISAGILRSTHANALQNAVVAASGMDIEDGLKIASGITSPVIGGLSGSANFELVNEDNVPLALQLGNTSATYDGVLSGAGSISKIGAGTQVLTASGQLYTGTTSVSGGSLQTNASGNSLSNLFGTGSVNLSNGGRVRFNSTAAATFNHDLVVGTGGGILSFRGNSNFTPASISASDTLTLSVDNTITISVTDLLDFAGTVNAVSAGAGGFFRLNSGFDNTSMANMALNLGAGMILSRNAGTSGVVTTDIGTLSGAATAIVGNSSAGGGAFIFSVGSRNEPAIYAGTIVDGGTKTAFTKVGTGIQTLSGINTYTGTTNVSAGTLALSGSGGIDNSASVTISAGAELDTTAKTGTYTLASTQPVTFGLNAAGGGTSGKIDAGALDISTATVAFNIVGTLDDSQYVLASYTSLTGTQFQSVTVPVGYTLNYGTGTNSQIKLVSLSGSDYDNWAVLNGASSIPDEDHDEDGVSNGVEFFIGGPNGNTTGFTTLPGVTTVGATRSVTWTHAADYTGTYGTDFVVQTSTTLAAGSWVNQASPGTVAISGNNVTYTFPVGPVKNFVRLMVTP